MSTSATHGDPRTDSSPMPRACKLVLGVFGGLALMGLMLVTVIDVAGRNVLDITVIGAYELSELAVGLVVATGIPLVALRSDHVYVDLATGLFKGAARCVQRVLVLIATSIAEGIVAWRVWAQADLAEQTQRVSSTLQIPVWPLLYIAAILFGVAALITLACVAMTCIGHASTHEGKPS